MKLVRLAGGLVVLLASTLFTIGPAVAAPTNDTWQNATVLSVDHAVAVDTTGATWDDAEAQVGANCWLPGPPSGGVWFAYTPPSDGMAYFQTRPENGSATIWALAIAGQPGSGGEWWCGWNGDVSWMAMAGTTYYMLVLDIGSNVQGEKIDVLVGDAATVPSAQWRVVSGRVNSLGFVTLTGSVQCHGTLAVNGSMRLVQRSGRSYVTATWTNFPIPCSSSISTWTVTMRGDRPFVGGKAAWDADLWVGAPNYLQTRFTPSGQLTLKGGKA